MGLLATVLASAAALAPFPADAPVDYQLGGDYPLPAGVQVVSRDWFSGKPAKDPVYSICYVNAYQTQANESGANRPDEQDNWPQRLILSKLGDDPNWGGEYLVDISTAAKRRQAAGWVEQMIDGCARKGYEAVEFDNLDSWTRFNGTPLAKKVPFAKPEALAYARLIAAYAHEQDLAVAQKNTAGLTKPQVAKAGFDFAVVEECGRYDECDVFERVYGDQMLIIEYRRKDFAEDCADIGERVAVVLRDRNLRPRGTRGYVYDSC